ncbi:UDP-glycosyltransferase 74B1 [Camellia lanceoleosa]|nr:UDP-glycosyltransferase 74B1 [Camellia lanceoleosa]
MVGVPKWLDQLTNAKFIDEMWEVGVRAKRDEKGVVKREELMSCLKQVMKASSMVPRTKIGRHKKTATDTIASPSATSAHVIATPLTSFDETQLSNDTQTVVEET